MTNRGDGRMDPDVLKALMSQAVETKDQTAEFNAEYSKDKKTAVEKHGLHSRAFSLCVTLKRMDQVKRLAFLDALDSYRHILKLDDAPQKEAFSEHQPKTLRAVT